MTRDEMVEILALAQVDPMRYSVGGDQHESLCLTSEKAAFHVFLSERGSRYEEKVFVTEDAACVYFLKRLFRLAPCSRRV